MNTTLKIGLGVLGLLTLYSIPLFSLLMIAGVILSLHLKRARA